MSTKDYDLKVEDIEAKYVKLLKELPQRVSNLAVNDFKDNFRRQGYRSDGGGITKWKKRKRSKSRRDETRAILVKTGKLRRGIQPAPQPMTARVINRVPYAAAHNEGSKETVNVKAHTRHRYAKLKVKLKGKNRTIKQKSASYKVKAYSRKNNLPARPFMITTKPLLNEIQKYIDRNLDLIIK